MCSSALKKPRPVLGQSRLCNRNTSINFMHDINVTARVGVLAAIGKCLLATVRWPPDNEMVAFENNLGKLGETWRGLALRWAWRIPEKWRNPPIICFGCRVRLTRRRNTRKPNLAVMARDVPTGPSGSKFAWNLRKGLIKSREFVGRFESLIGNVGLS